MANLKSWESPRRRGRNDKGKGGSARARQLRKQQQVLRQKLKGVDKPKLNPNQNEDKNERKGFSPFLSFFRHNWSKIA